MEQSRPVLLVVPSLREAWDDAIAPWFDQVLPETWKRTLPSLVAVPTRGQANDLKARLIAKGSSHLGLHFVTPASLGALLARDDATLRAKPEHLRLLLAIAASKMEDRPNEPEALAAKAVARAPAPLLRALDRLETAGWKFEELALPSFAPVVQHFNELLKKCNFVLPGESDRRRLQQAMRGERKFSHVLVIGFDGAHWPQWFLLRTAVELAEHATVVLEEPRGNFSDVDLCWIGSWEEVCGEAQRTPKSVHALGDSFFSETEMRGGAEAAKHFDFLVGTNLSEQSEAVAQQCVRYLMDEKCTRLGVIFPSSGALPRLVASSLARLDIPHNDGLGHIVPGIFESAEWQAWLELQRAPRLNSFLRFLNALSDPAALSPTLSRSALEKILCESYSEVLLDDLEILREFCAARTDKKFQSVAEALRALPFLPPLGTLAQFLEQTHAALAYLGWKQHALEIVSITRDWPQRFDTEFPRTFFLRWLEETAATFGAARSASQGEGHTSVRENHSLYLGPSEQRAIALRQFDALLESASEGVTLAASLVQEDAPERLWNPSECFTQLYLTTRREPLTQATLKHLQRATAQFINDPCLLTRQSELPRTDVQQTLIAFNARRDASKPASEYDFAFRTNQSYRPMPTLSVSDLERMVSSPAIVWMKRYLGVEAPDDTANPWATTSGKWVHRWLASISETKDGKLFAAFPSSAIIDERVRVSADERRAALQQLCDALGKVVPDWWNSGWLNARYLARYLGGKIASVEGWGWMVAELPIGREGAVKITEEVELHLRGQIDLVLAQNDAADFAGQKIWIVDYKTGSTKELKTSDLHDNLVKGTTLQLGLYALAVRKLGAAEVNVSILSLAVKHVGPQLSIVDLAPHTDVFADLAEMQRTGIFGMKGEVRPAFGHSTLYPLATLQIDNDILEDKWALTHPALVLEKEEWEIW